MPTPFLYFIVLQCLLKINGERTIYSTYHLLCGKKSSQTIQDAHLFQLTQYFNTFNSLSRQQFSEIIAELESGNLILQGNNDVYKLTKSGIVLVKSGQKKYSFLKYLNGWKFQQTEIFWQRLSLLVQVVSHLTRNEIRYVPVQSNKDVQHWLKRFIQESNLRREELGVALYKELSNCFLGLNEFDPSILVIRLTGYNYIGLTEKQAAEALNEEPSFYHYQFISLMHAVMNTVLGHKTSYPILTCMIRDLQNDVPLTDSTRRTYELLKRGYSIDEISRIRKLKHNTIQDHIVELSLQLSLFDISPYVETNKINRIMEAKDRSSSKQLRQIKEYVPDASYFEIRLVLTKYGGEP